MTDAERAAWLERRRDGIGASDAAAVCGMSKWRTPLRVYADKVEGDSRPMSEEQRWGLLHEPTMAAEYARQTGEAVHRPHQMVAHPSLPWMFATLDGFVPDGRGGIDRLVEFKTTRYGDGWGEAMTDQVPTDYLIQTQHQMAVVGVDAADIAVLIAGSDFRVYRVRADPDLQARVTQIERDFWTRVERRLPPPPDWSHPETPRLVERLTRPTVGVVAEAGSELAAVGRDYIDARANRKTWTDRCDALKDEITRLAADAAEVALPSGHRLVRRVVVKKPYTVTPEPYTEVRVVEPKEDRNG